MFPRLTRVRRSPSKVDEYVQLVESYRDDRGRTCQRVVVSLGRKDQLSAQLDALVRLLDRPRRWLDSDQLAAPEQAPAWGRLLALRQTFQQLGLEDILTASKDLPPRGQARLADRVLVLAANRLCAPSSEHGLARWLETEFVCDRRGRRWLPAWRDDDERRRSRRPRVRVQDAQLNGWYRTLDALAAHKATIEKQLFLRLRDLFSLRPEMIFYDLTSTYFEGRGPGWRGTATRATANRASAKSWSGCCGSTAGRSPIMCFAATCATPRRSRGCSTTCGAASDCGGWCSSATAA